MRRRDPKWASMGTGLSFCRMRVLVLRQEDPVNRVLASEAPNGSYWVPCSCHTAATPARDVWAAWPAGAWLWLLWGGRRSPRQQQEGARCSHTNTEYRHCCSGNRVLYLEPHSKGTSSWVIEKLQTIWFGTRQWLRDCRKSLTAGPSSSGFPGHPDSWLSCMWAAGTSEVSSSHTSSRKLP